jgi:hypothetical protein
LFELLKSAGDHHDAFAVEQLTVGDELMRCTYIISVLTIVP